MSGQGVATTKTASARTGSPEASPGGAGDQRGRRQEERRVAVGHAHEGRALALGLLHEPHERRVGALSRRAERTQLEGAPGARSAATHLTAPMHRGRQRLARQRRLVDDRLLAQNQPVHRHDLACAHEHRVSGDDVVYR